MSYILDALRKAEMERELSRVPGISSRQPFSQAVSRFPASPWLLAAAALTIGAGGTWMWMRFELPNQEQAMLPVNVARAAVPPTPGRVKPIPGSTPVKDKAEERSEPSSVSEPMLVPVALNEQTVRQEPATEKVSSPSSSDRVSPPPADTLVEAPKSVASAPQTAPPNETVGKSESDHVLAMIAAEAEQGWPEQHPLQAPQPPSPAQAEQPVKGQEETLAPLLSTLPYRFQNTVPQIVINAQAYAEELEARFVIINMKKYREGERTPEGILIERIGKAQLVLSYHGQSFRMQR